MGYRRLFANPLIRFVFERVLWARNAGIRKAVPDADGNADDISTPIPCPTAKPS